MFRLLRNKAAAAPRPPATLFTAPQTGALSYCVQVPVHFENLIMVSVPAGERSIAEGRDVIMCNYLIKDYLNLLKV